MADIIEISIKYNCIDNDTNIYKLGFFFFNKAGSFD